MPINEVGSVADPPGEQRQPGKPTDFQVAMFGDSKQVPGGSGFDRGLSVVSEGGDSRSLLSELRGSSRSRFQGLLDVSSLRDHLPSGRRALATVTITAAAFAGVDVTSACAPSCPSSSGVQAAMVRAEGTGGGATGGATGGTHEGSPSPVGSADAEPNSKAPTRAPSSAPSSSDSNCEPDSGADAEATQGPFIGTLWWEKRGRTYTDLAGKTTENGKIEIINEAYVEVEKPTTGNCPPNLEITITTQENGKKNSDSITVTLPPADSSTSCSYENTYPFGPTTYAPNDERLTVTLPSPTDRIHLGVGTGPILDSNTANHYQPQAPGNKAPKFGDPIPIL